MTKKSFGEYAAEPAISGRADDANDTVVRNRLAVYKNETAPVFDYYAKQGKSHRIDGMGSVEEIFQRLCTLIDQTIHSLKKGALI